MADKHVFCSVPWTSVHLYWDGSFGMCCNEAFRPYSPEEWNIYNIKNMTIGEWFNQPPMQNSRENINGSKKIKNCQFCYHSEQVNYESKRIKENFKTVIFTKQAFEKSFNQSPWYNRFSSKIAIQPPIDWHIDFGNECNLACKMCSPQASSLIESKYKKWEIPHERRKMWTLDEISWKNFLTSIDKTTINRIHLMGGETLLNKRFYQLIDYLIENKRFEISLSFASNGTIFQQSLVDKLRKFRQVDIEISIDAFNEQQNYIRQGLKTPNLPIVFETINNLLAQQSENLHLVLRSVPQLLNVTSYHEYIKWAWDHKVSVQGNLLSRPRYLSIDVLPFELRQKLIINYQNIKDHIHSSKVTAFQTITTGRDVSRLDLQLIKECDSIIHMLQQKEPDNAIELRKELSKWLMRWDKEFNLNAFNVYPEFTVFLNEIQYRV